MAKRITLLIVAAAICALMVVGCSSGTTSPDASKASTSASFSASATSASSSSSAVSATAGSSSSTASQGDSDVKKLLSKCAQDYYDIGDPLLDAIFSNNTSQVQSYLDKVNSDLDQLNALADVPEEYQAGVDCMKNCLSKYSEALNLYVEGSKYVNRDDAKADEYFNQAEPVEAEAHEAYQAYIDATAGLIVAPTKRSSSNTGSSSSTGSSNTTSSSTTTTTKPSTTTTTTSKVTDENMQGMLLANAQAVVRDHLKSPSSAKFPWAFSEYTFVDKGPSSKHPGYHTYSISGPVEAQNSYGAQIKGVFKVEIDYYKDAETYYEVSCVIN